MVASLTCSSARSLLAMLDLTLSRVALLRLAELGAVLDLLRILIVAGEEAAFKAARPTPKPVILC